MFITIFSWCLCPLQVYTTLTQCRINAGPPLPALTSIHSTLGSASCWQQGVHRVHAETGPMSVKCWASVASTGKHPFNTEQLILLAGCAWLPCTLCTDYRFSMPAQSWAIVVSHCMSIRREICGWRLHLPLARKKAQGIHSQGWVNAGEVA